MWCGGLWLGMFLGYEWRRYEPVLVGGGGWLVFGSEDSGDGFHTEV